MKKSEHPKPPIGLPKGSPPPPPPGPADMMRCGWCGVPVDERQANVNGDHKDFMSCIEALKKQRKALLQELIDERVYTASLTEQLEMCAVCPVADYEKQKGAIDGRNLCIP